MKTPKMNQRNFLKKSALGTAGLVAAASELPTVSASTKPISRRYANQSTTTLTLVDPWGAASQLSDALDAQIARFMDANPGIEIQRSEIPFEEFRQLLIQGAFAFLMAWGEFIFALSLNQRDNQPITIALNTFIGQYGTFWNNLMTVSIIAALPIILVFAGLQRFIVGGLISGAVKE